jgi:hypothetical protein
VHVSHPTDDPILIEESICEDSAQVCLETDHAAAGRNVDANHLTSINSVEVLPFDPDIACFGTESNSLPIEDPHKSPLHEHESPPRLPTPHHTIVHPSGATAKEQEGNLELDEEDNAGTIGVECATSDRYSESSDDSNDEEYVEEPRRLRKRKRVRFSKTVKYTPDGPQETPMSPADTVDNESQGSSSDVAYASEEVPVSGVLTLKEINGRMQYSLTFSQDPLPRLLGQRQSDRSNTSRSTPSDRSRSSLVQGRGTAGRGRYKFKDEDDENIIQWREEGKSWDDIVKLLPESTKQSIQVRYSTKLKHRMAVVAGFKKGRETDEETILFWHRGLSLSDIALGKAALAKAERLKLGQSLRFA